MMFLSKPSNLWRNGKLEERQTVTRLVFADRLTYARNEGFRTPQTSSIFKALEGFKGGNFKMAERDSAEHGAKMADLLLL